MIDQVFTFNRVVLGKGETEPHLVDSEEMALSLHQFREEVQEIEDAYNAGSLVGVVDGLIDLQYYILGVVYKLGISEAVFRQCFDLVHLKNMEKMKGKKKGRDQYDAADAVKPEGWVGPEEEMAAIIFPSLSSGHRL